MVTTGQLVLDSDDEGNPTLRASDGEEQRELSARAIRRTVEGLVDQVFDKLMATEGESDG